MADQKHLITFLPQFEDFKILVSLFENVENSADIKDRVVSQQSNTNDTAIDQVMDYAFISAASIYSLEQLFAAIFRALTDHEIGASRTRSLHSDIIFCLSPTNNIMDGLRRFGIGPDSKAVLVVKITKATEGEEVLRQAHRDLNEIVNGVEMKVCDESLEQLYQPEILMKNYKLSKDFDLSNRALTNSALVGSLSLRGL